MTSNKNNIKIKKGQDQLKVAIVHDFLLYMGGAERVLHDIANMFPNAPIYTLLYDKDRIGAQFSDRDIRTSFLQKWPKWLKKHYRWLMPFFGTAIESFDLRDFDLVISSSGAWSKGIVTRLNTKHVAYIHSPMRYVWDENERYLKKAVGKRNRFCIRLLLSYLRVWDHQAAQRPDALIANSVYTKKKIEKYYRREASVVYPAVSLKERSQTTPKSHPLKGLKEKSFLIISRLSKYKNVALAIEVCNKLQLPLTVVGDGRERSALESIAGETVEIVGYVSEEEKVQYLANARALLFPAEDDFGIVCVEAMQTGTPVIALGMGGARETVISGVTGELFEAPTIEMLADAMRRFLEKENTYDKNVIKAEGQKYTFDKFKRELSDVIEHNTKL